jgi:hypothetical protein
LQNLRLETQSAIRIQSLVRRFLVSRRFQHKFRDEFDQLKAAAGGGGGGNNLDLLDELLKRLFLFFLASRDRDRLVS